MIKKTTNKHTTKQGDWTDWHAKKKTIRQAHTQNGKQKTTLTEVENSIRVIMKLQF